MWYWGKKMKKDDALPAIVFCDPVCFFTFPCREVVTTLLLHWTPVLSKRDTGTPLKSSLFCLCYPWPDGELGRIHKPLTTLLGSGELYSVQLNEQHDLYFLECTGLLTPDMPWTLSGWVLWHSACTTQTEISILCHPHSNYAEGSGYILRHLS